MKMLKNTKYNIARLSLPIFGAAAMAGCTPEPHDGPTYGNPIITAKTLDDIIQAPSTIQAFPNKQHTLQIVGQIPVDSIDNAKTLPDAFRRLRALDNVRIDRRQGSIIATDGKAWTFANWNQYQIPVDLPRPVAASVIDSAAFAKAGFPGFTVKHIDTQTINLTAEMAMNFDETIAKIARTTSGTIKIIHNGHPLVIKDAATLLKFAHPSAPIANAIAWSDINPNYATIKSATWDLGTGTYLGDRIATSDTPTKLVTDSTKTGFGTITQSTTDENMYYNATGDYQTGKILIAIDGDSWPIDTGIYNVNKLDDTPIMYLAVSDFSKYQLVAPAGFPFINSDLASDRIRNKVMVLKYLEARGIGSSNPNFNIDNLTYITDEEYAKQVALGRRVR